MSTGRKRGFNAAKQGSGQVGFQTAPPVHPDVPTPVDWAEELLSPETDEPSTPGIDPLYGTYTTLIERNMDASLEGLSEEEKTVVLEARAKLQTKDLETNILSHETQHTAHALMSAWGLKEEEQQNALRELSLNSIPQRNNYYEYVPGTDSEYELRELIEAAPFSSSSQDRDTQNLLNRVRNGEILLTRHELDYLTQLRDQAHETLVKARLAEERRALDANWIPAAVNRQCKLCGEFISTRDTHGVISHTALRPLDGSVGNQPKISSYACSFDVGEPEYSTFARTIHQGQDSFYGYSGDYLHLIEDEDLDPRYVTKTKIEIPQGDKKNTLLHYSTDYLEDAYMVNPPMRPLIVTLYTEKEKRFSRNKKIILPQQIREALVEAPNVHYGTKSGVVRINPMIASIAAKIDPPLNDQEIKRIIDRGDDETLVALLAVNRTRSTAQRIISDYPSQASRMLAIKPGGLDEETLTLMASSGSARVRAHAASSPDLREDDVLRLAHDPDPMVRRALAVPHVDTTVPGEQLPPSNNYNSALSRHREQLGETLINDPDPEIAYTTFAAIGPSTTIRSQYNGEWGTSSETIYHLSTGQKYLISKIRSRKRFNELKQYVISDERYDRTHEDTARFLAH